MAAHGQDLHDQDDLREAKMTIQEMVFWGE
jgi:hypothetical protein